MLPEYGTRHESIRLNTQLPPGIPLSRFQDASNRSAGDFSSFLRRPR
jgi:hypothetical protein